MAIMDGNMILDDLLANIDVILNRLQPNKLDAYALTQNRLHEVNVSNDELYRRTYTGFYRLRLPATDAYDAYFLLIEREKNNADITLEEILLELQQATGRIETSFASKLLATINPNVAPLDDIVLGNLGLALPNYQEINRIQLCINTHNQLVQRMNHLITLPQFQELKERFIERFPGYDFTDVKILDLLLWQHRP
jgi:hypothetical protein